jgi:hypothetical protein
MRLQRIKYFPFHARLIEPINITNYEFQPQVMEFFGCVTNANLQHPRCKRG